MTPCLSALLLDLHHEFTAFVASFEGEDKVGLEFVAAYSIRSRVLENAAHGGAGAMMFFDSRYGMDVDEQRILDLCEGDTPRALQAVIDAADRLGLYAYPVSGEGPARIRIGIPEVEEALGYHDGAYGVPT